MLRCGLLLRVERAADVPLAAAEDVAEVAAVAAGDEAPAEDAARAAGC